MTFHNTTGETGETLKTSEEKAKTQDEAVLEFFQKNPDYYLSPDDVHKALCVPLNNPPLTSIRRAISNLTKAGKLIKTNHTSIGRYKKQVLTWRLAGGTAD